MGDEINLDQIIFTCSILTTCAESYLEKLSDEELMAIYDHVMKK